MSVLDLFILAVIGALAVLGFWRGFIKEITETVGAIASAFFTYLLYEPIVTILQFDDTSSWIKKALVFLLTFIALMILVSILGSLVRKFIKSISLGMYDHMLGLISGALKGGIIVTVLLTLAIWIGPPLDEAVRSSRMARASLLTFDFLIEMFPQSVQQSRLAELRPSTDAPASGAPRQSLSDLCPLPQALTDSFLVARLHRIPGIGSTLSLLDSTMKLNASVQGTIREVASATQEGSVEYQIGGSVFSVPWFVGSLKGDSMTVSKIAIDDSVRFTLSYSRLLDRLCAVEMEPVGVK